MKAHKGLDKKGETPSKNIVQFIGTAYLFDYSYKLLSTEP